MAIPKGEWTPPFYLSLVFTTFPAYLQSVSCPVWCEIISNRSIFDEEINSDKEVGEIPSEEEYDISQPDTSSPEHEDQEDSDSEVEDHIEKRRKLNFAVGNK